MFGWMERLRAFQQHWTHGRRAFAPAGLLALIVAIAASALVAAADAPARSRPAADTHRSRPEYLLPIGALIRQGWLPAPTLTGDRGWIGVPAGTPPPPSIPNPGRAAQQAPAIAPFRGPGGTITPAGIATLALEHGCAPDAAVIATAIAMAESGGSPSAQGDIALMDSVWDWSAGLWQIRGLRIERNTGGIRDSVANQAAGTNAAAMEEISRGCADWTPWSTYNTGAYLRFLSLARQAVTYIVGWFNAHGHHYPPVGAPDPTATIPTGGSAAVAGGPASAAPPRRTSTSHRPRPRRSSPAQAPSATSAAQPQPQQKQPAPASTAVPAPVSSAKGGGGLPLPLPLPSKSSSSSKKKPPLPLPSVTLPPPPSVPGLP